MRMAFLTGLTAVLVTAGCVAAGNTARVTIDATNQGPRIGPYMFGIFLEEINHGVDGGLYAELIRNRGFEDNNPPKGLHFDQQRNSWVDEGGWGGFRQAENGLPSWRLIQRDNAKATMQLTDANPLSVASPHSLCLRVEATGGWAGVANEGYWGMNCEPRKQYAVSLYARCGDGYAGTIEIGMIGQDGAWCTKPAKIEGIRGEWKRCAAVIEGVATNRQAQFAVMASSKGTLWLDIVSVMPADVWRKRPNNLRPDLAQKIADLKPSFVRFPGGCAAEGGTIETAYHWRETIGPQSDRVPEYNAWNYYRTHGMGYFEYLQFCEDLGAEPLYVAFAGQTCVWRAWENVPMDKMGDVVKENLDALEYANGPASSQWGAWRAKAGHPAPFNMKLFGIGNENIGKEYEERYALIYNAVKPRYSNVTFIACSKVKSAPVDMVDDHRYVGTRWLLNTDDTYDKYNRNDPPVYIGEISTYARDTEGGYNLLAGLCEAAYMMNLERNADVVRMVSYAPLLAHVNGRTGWHGCINFDSYRVFATPAYYTQKMYSCNRPSYTVATRVEANMQASNERVRGGIAIESMNAGLEVKDIKVVRDGKAVYASSLEKGTDGLKASEQWKRVNGALVTSNGGVIAIGGTNWEDCTISFKMKWTGTYHFEHSGLLLHFGIADGGQYEWKVSHSGRGSFMQGYDFFYNNRPVDKPMNDGQWHEMKLEIKRLHVKAEFDGALHHDVEFHPLWKFVAQAGYDEKAGEMIIKAVNTSPEAVDATVALEGVKTVAAQGEMTVMTSPRVTDRNTLEEPEFVVPKTSAVNGLGLTFKRTFPANSFSIIRVKAK